MLKLNNTKKHTNKVIHINFKLRRVTHIDTYEYENNILRRVTTDEMHYQQYLEAENRWEALSKKYNGGE